MTETMKRHGGIALAFMLALVPATATYAADDGSSQADQSDSSASSSSASGMAPEDVTDQHLEKFAAAYQQMQQVRAEYGKKLQQAKDDKAKQKQLREEGQQEMVSAIRDEGLKIAEYRQIGQALNSDKELRSRFKGIIQDKQSGNGDSGDSGSG